MSITSVFQVIQLLVPAIQTAEDFIRGRGRGGEKKEAVLGNFASQVLKLKEELKQTANVDLKNYNWIKFALSGPEFLAKVGVLVDAIVDLANFVQSFDNKEEESAPVVIN